VKYERTRGDYRYAVPIVERLLEEDLRGIPNHRKLFEFALEFPAVPFAYLEKYFGRFASRVGNLPFYM
jgi:hypothetical protein